MQQFIYHQGNLEARKAMVTSLVETEGYLLTHLSGIESPLKIAEIRELQHAIATTASRPRLIWIEEANTLTLPAQHALLKTLEEPPEQITIILTLNTTHSLLPTIISRCQVIAVETPIISTDNQDLQLIKSALSANAGERLQLAANLGKKRTELIPTLETIIRTLHSVIGETTAPRALNLLSQISTSALLALTRLRANTNPTLAIESLFLSLPKVSSS